MLFAWTVLSHGAVALAALSLANKFALPSPVALSIALTALLIVPFRGCLLSLLPDRPRPAWKLWLVDLPYFAHWFAASIALLLLSIAAVVLGVFPWFGAGRSFEWTSAALWSYCAGALVALWSVGVRRYWVRVKRLSIVVSGLDPAFEGYSIVHLTDLHLGSFTTKSMGLAWAEKVKALEPDLIVVTGDLITSGTGFNSVAEEVIAALRAREGVVITPGNHDYFGDPESLFESLRKTGARVLRNEALVLQRGSAQLVVAGVDDTWTALADLEAALTNRPAGAPVLLLSHDPDLFPLAACAGVEVMLSGHTHGGQVAVPFLARWLSFSRLASRYAVGFYREGRSLLYVNSGLGVTGPPLRLGSAPEIALLRLVSPSRP